MSMTIKNFKDLEIWQLSVSAASKIYEITNSNNFSKDFSLKDQIRRATVSISSNIAEGFEGNGNTEFIRFLKIAKGSLAEVRTQLIIALNIKYINEKEYNSLENELVILAGKIGSFINYLTKLKKLSQTKTAKSN